VIEDGMKMVDQLRRPVGRWQSGYALAHSQITKKDPLRFFVTTKGDAIINPKITWKPHENQAEPHNEGCYTFHSLEDRTVYVPRFEKIKAEWYELMEDGKVSPKVTAELRGMQAKVFQHEIDHMDGIYIYDKQTTSAPKLGKNGKFKR